MTKPDFNAIAKKMLTDLRRAQHDPNDVAIAVAALRAARIEGMEAAHDLAFRFGTFDGLTIAKQIRALLGAEGEA